MFRCGLFRWNVWLMRRTSAGVRMAVERMLPSMVVASP